MSSFDPNVEVGYPGSASVTILDDDGGPILVSISPSYVNVAEGGPDTTFTVSRTGDLSAPLDVNFNTSPWDSATAGVDYQLSTANVVTIPAGAASASFTLSVVDDTVQENTEFATISLVSGVGYELMWPSYAQVSIADNDGPPVVSIAATDPIASEPGLPEGTATFTLTRIGGDLAAPLTVSYSNAWFDSATAGVDYVTLPGTVTFEPGQSTETITITPIDDLVGEDSETVSIQLNNPLDGTYLVDWSNSFATATILDDDGGIPIVSWEATVPTVVEGSGGAATVTLTRTGGNLNTPLTVNYYTGLFTPGTARSGVDYQTLPYSLTFAAGSSTATIDVVPIDDALGEQDETVVLSLGFYDPTGTYVIGASGDTELTILDDDGGQAAVSLAVTDPRAMEASTDPATFTVTRAGGNLNAPLTVSYVLLVRLGRAWGRFPVAATPGHVRGRPDECHDRHRSDRRQHQRARRDGQPVPARVGRRRLPDRLLRGLLRHGDHRRWLAPSGRPDRRSGQRSARADARLLGQLHRS